LKTVAPTDEQLKIVSRVRGGVELIRGAAGSGKTTTAILRLRLLLPWVQRRRIRADSYEPVRALVLTYNKTLKGYVKEIVKDTIARLPGGKAPIEVTIDTFHHWAWGLAAPDNLTEDDSLLDQFVLTKSRSIGLPQEFVGREARYVMGRFLPDDLPAYIASRRHGKGKTPRVDNAVREALLNDVIYPYSSAKDAREEQDWNDVAVDMASTSYKQYDIIIVDECQDFSANMLRAVLNQRAPESSTTFIIDTAQRIYHHAFLWPELGLSIRPEDSHRLQVNYRNTPEIARLSASLIKQVELDEDGTKPEEGGHAGNRRPVVLAGRYPEQVVWALQFIEDNVDLENESVAFLHAKGRGWFKDLRVALRAKGLAFEEITSRGEWPDGDANIALSTMHSAKGLDFDHVVILGLDNNTLLDGEQETGDDRFEFACRLVSMAIARARLSVTLGYDPRRKSAIINRLDASAYDEVKV